MIEELNTKQKILQAFDTSEKKTVADVCRIAGVIPSTYYFHFYKDAAFRKAVLEKQQQHLANRIQSIGA